MQKLKKIKNFKCLFFQKIFTMNFRDIYFYLLTTTMTHRHTHCLLVMFFLKIRLKKKLMNELSMYNKSIRLFAQNKIRIAETYFQNLQKRHEKFMLKKRKEYFFRQKSVLLTMSSSNNFLISQNVGHRQYLSNFIFHYI